MMKRSIHTALMALLVVCGLAIAKEPSMASRLILKVSTHSGPAPLDLELTGSLPGVPQELLATCLVQTDYNYVLPSGSPVDKRSTSPCVKEPSEQGASRAFSKKLLLVEPGLYTYRILLTSEGRQIAGMSHHVKVYHPLEIGVSGGVGTTRKN